MDDSPGGDVWSDIVEYDNGRMAAEPVDCPIIHQTGTPVVTSSSALSEFVADNSAAHGHSSAREETLIVWHAVHNV